MGCATKSAILRSIVRLILPASSIGHLYGGHLFVLLVMSKTMKGEIEGEAQIEAKRM